MEAYKVLLEALEARKAELLDIQKELRLEIGGVVLTLLADKVQLLNPMTGCVLDIPVSEIPAVIDFLTKMTSPVSIVADHSDNL